MSDILAIVEQADNDAQLVDEIARSHPDRVTVLVENGSDGFSDAEPVRDRALRERLMRLRATIEARTGAVITGLVGSRDQLRGWRFDRVVTAGGAPSFG
jgi:hypothetical protein